MIKNNLLTKWFTRHFNILDRFLPNLRSKKIAWAKVVTDYSFLFNSKQTNQNNLRYFHKKTYFKTWKSIKKFIY